MCVCGQLPIEASMLSFASSLFAHTYTRAYPAIPTGPSAPCRMRKRAPDRRCCGALQSPSLHPAAVIIPREPHASGPHYHATCRRTRRSSPCYMPPRPTTCTCACNTHTRALDESPARTPSTLHTAGCAPARYLIVHPLLLPIALKVRDRGISMRAHAAAPFTPRPRRTHQSASQ